MNMISEQAFAFPFKDKIWVNKFLIGAALVLAGFIIPIIPTVFVWGYLVRLMRDTINTGETAMPEWENWEDLGLKGVYYLVIIFIYLLPGLVLLAGAVALFAASRLVGGEPLVPESILSVTYATSLVSRMLLFASFIGLPISLLVLTVGYILTPVAIARFAATGLVKAALELDRVWEVIRAQLGNFVLAWVVSWGISWAITIMVGVLYNTVCLCCLIPFASAPLYLYQWLFRAGLFAHVYRNGISGPPPVAPLLGPGPGEPEATPVPQEVAAVESAPTSVSPEPEVQAPAAPSGAEATDKPVLLAAPPAAEEPVLLAAPSSEAAEPMGIGALALPPRMENMLLDAGYSTVPQIVEALRTDESKLLEIKGFGDKSLETLKASLGEKGIQV
jgi:hypothetical protein